METITIISLSVLSTLAVVAIVIVIIMSFHKKVNAIEESMCEIINQDRYDLNAKMEKHNLEFNKQLAALKSEFDSRCDKLHKKIETSQQK